MAYLLCVAIISMALLLGACTFITVNLGGKEGEFDPAPLNIQSSNSTSIMSSQNVKKDDMAGKGAVSTGDQAETSQGALSTPTLSVPLPK